ncbi:UNKNOWN [Stylonychia lemnae]|uniref:Transmembrane protein n=1 Tax=Stylonychia lemnae TaxID=5949 RepID=A0A077ZR37_STYLE|nr:UNKNOWN [Stylonychia lemnae]|eukprot:CDW72378.1 UNKNOWN [Stylonychia lemnae]
MLLILPSREIVVIRSNLTIEYIHFKNWMNEGVIIISDCSLLQTNTQSGNIVLRYLQVSMPHIYITSLFNVTLDNCDFRSFSLVSDANKQQIYVDSTSLCPIAKDNLTRTIQFSNNYISTDAKQAETSHQIFLWCVFKSDLNMRNLKCIVENVTAEHFYSSISFFCITVLNHINATYKNITQNNITLGPLNAFHYQLVGSYTSKWNIKFQQTLLLEQQYKFQLHKIRRCRSFKQLTQSLEMKFLLVNSTFSLNQFQKEGGLILIDSYLDENNARMIIQSSEFKNNSFSSGGFLIQARQNQIYPVLIQDSIFENNFQAFIQVKSFDVQMIRLPTVVEIIGCQFNQNYPNIKALIQLNSNSKVYLRNTVFQKTLSHSRGSVILADYEKVEVGIQNCTFKDNFASNGGVFFSHYSGFINISDSFFLNNLAISGGIGVLENYARVIVFNTQISGNYAIRNSIFSSLDALDIWKDDYYYQTYVISDIIKENLDNTRDRPQYQMNLAKSNLIIMNSSIEATSESDFLMKADSSNISLLSSNFSGLQSNGTTLSDVKRCVNYNITNTRIENFNVNLFEISITSLIVNSSVFLASKQQSSNDIIDQKMIFSVYKGEIKSYNSIFNYGSSRVEGGAILSQNTNTTLINNKFENNQAKDGGAIAFQCSRLENNTFNKNIASLQGGAVYYNKHRPLKLDSNQFDTQNYAPYGSNIAGFPFSVKILSYDKLQVASGQRYEGKIVAAIVDYDQNIISIDNSSGENLIQVQNGIGILDDLIFISTPGSGSVQFQVQSPSIDTDYIKQVFFDELDTHDLSQVNSAIVNLDFRNCIEGETVQNDQCYICGLGFYSFNGLLSSCLECPNNADCPGGSKIAIYPGFWRSSDYSSHIINCLNKDACVGGYKAKNTSEDEYKFPQCAFGYGGNLCHQCQLIDDNTQFTRISDHQCGLCPPRLQNIFFIFGVCIGLLIVISFILWYYLRDSKENQTSVIIRIILNHIQILSTAAAFNLQWPQQFSEFLGFYTSVGEIAESLISFDCFLKDTGFAEKGSSTYYFKVMIITLLPLLLLIIFSSGLTIINIIRKQKLAQISRQLTVTFVVIIYTLHPTLTRMSTSLFFCMELDTGEAWLQEDLQIECWSIDHLKWAIGLGLTSIIIWTVLCPLIGYRLLTKHRKQLYDDEIFGKYKLLYQGLDPRVYYWEFLNVIRKTALVCINVFLNLYPNIFKALVSLIILVIFLRLQIRLKPYKNPILNSLEQREIVISIFTFFGALYFVSDEISKEVEMGVFSFILIANAWFFVYCVYCIFSSLKGRISLKLASILRPIVLSKSMEQLENTYKQNLRYQQEREILIESGLCEDKQQQNHGYERSAQNTEFLMIGQQLNAINSFKSNQNTDKKKRLKPQYQLSFKPNDPLSFNNQDSHNKSHTQAKSAIDITIFNDGDKSHNISKAINNSKQKKTEKKSSKSKAEKKAISKPIQDSYSFNKDITEKQSKIALNNKKIVSIDDHNIATNSKMDISRDYSIDNEDFALAKQFKNNKKSRKSLKEPQPIVFQNKQYFDEEYKGENLLKPQDKQVFKNGNSLSVFQKIAFSRQNKKKQ